MLHIVCSENADNIYVIDKENYDLLYVNGFKRAFWNEEGQNTPKCYEHIYNKKRALFPLYDEDGRVRGNAL